MNDKKQQFRSIESNEPIYFEKMKVKREDIDLVKKDMYRDNYRIRKALKKYGITAQRIH